MEEKRITTELFIKSNKSFYNALFSSIKPPINIYIIVELLVLYFHINEEYLSYLEPDKIVIINNLLSNNYIINGNYIVFPNNQVSYIYLLSIIRELKEIIMAKRNSKIIEFPLSKVEDDQLSERKNPKVIRLNQGISYPNYTFEERAYIFEITRRINYDTNIFIDENKSNRVKNLNELIESLLFNAYYPYTNIDLSLIYSYLSLYPFLDYNKDSYLVNLEQLRIPQERIGLTKTTYSNIEVQNIINEIMRLREERNSLKKRSELMALNKVNKAKIEQLHHSLSENRKKQERLIFEYYFLTHLPPVYNVNLLSYILKSIYQANIYINTRYDDPIFKFYNINNKNVEFFCSIHLSDLVNLIDYNILSPAPYIKKLEVENE